MTAPATKAATSIEVTDRAPMRLAEIYLDACGRDGDIPTIRLWRDEWWKWRREVNCYRPASPAEMGRDIRRLLDHVVVREGKEGAETIRPFNPRERDVIEVIRALPAIDDVLVDGDAPRPLRIGTARPRAVSLRNGVFDLDTGELLPPSPDYFAVSSLGTHYDSSDRQPEHWIEFLHSLWPKDVESWATLQEWFGYLLTADTRQQKILLMVGPKRSGKGTIARVLGALLGSDACCYPTLSSLGTHFGTWQLLNKSLAIVSDARLGGRADQTLIAERLLSISGEDGQLVDRKHLPPVTTRLPVRFMLLTNELPRIGDTSGALASRFLILRLEESFYGREDKHLTDRLLRELPAIFRWSVEGLRRLEKRGAFVQPASAAEDVEDLHALSSPVRAFIEEKCSIAPEAEVSAAEMFAAWRSWCDDNGRQHPGDAATFGRNLRSVHSTVKRHERRIPGTDKKQRVYLGVGLR